MTTIPARDCKIYHRRSPKAREVQVPELLTLAVAKARACMLSDHPLQDLRPYYVAVYDGQNAYPVAVYQAGRELAGEALVIALTQPHTERPHAQQKA